MLQLERFTTQYVIEEDRLRLSGQGHQGQVLVLWLTQRLLNRLVPYFCHWLHERAAGSMPEALLEVQNSFEQQSAKLALQQNHEAPVQASDTEPPAQVLVHSVDVSKTDTELTLSFKDVQSIAHARLLLPAPALRQWLSIIQEQYAQAQWPVQDWPEWLRGSVSTTAPASSSSVLLH